MWLCPAVNLSGCQKSIPVVAQNLGAVTGKVIVDRIGPRTKLCASNFPRQPSNYRVTPSPQTEWHLSYCLQPLLASLLTPDTRLSMAYIQIARFPIFTPAF